MTDLDFDELDKAVNSLMTKAPKIEEKPGLVSEQTLTIEPTATESITAPLVAPVTSDNSRPTALSAPSVASRRGRFMDVVRPGATPSPTLTRPISRQAAMIEPGRPLVSDIIPSSPAPVQKQSSPVTDPDPVPVTSDSAPAQSNTVSDTSEWPDPLDMARQHDEKTDLSDLSLPKEQEPVRKDEEEPLASPFLADAKVEKRPLGGAPLAAPDTDDAQPEPEQGDVKAAAQLPATPPDLTQALPEELSGDVMALEADANTVALPAKDVAAEAAAQVVAAESMPVQANTSTLQEVEVDETPKPVAEPLLPQGPISIPQQYKEAPSTGDKENGTIYDTDTYHQPLAHPKKKKSGWMWVVWIVLILAVGAVGGAALYYLGVV
jgi:hypothetical protein